MTTPALTHIDNTQEQIHSHDVIDRIAELERRKAAAEAEGEPFDCEDESELCDLVDLELQCLDRGPNAWRHGTRIAHDGSELARAWQRGICSMDHVDFAGVTYWLRVG